MTVGYMYMRFAKLTINKLEFGCHIHCTLTIIFFNNWDLSWPECAIHGVVSNDGLFALFQDGRIIRWSGQLCHASSTSLSSTPLHVTVIASLYTFQLYIPSRALYVLTVCLW